MSTSHVSPAHHAGAEHLELADEAGGEREAGERQQRERQDAGEQRRRAAEPAQRREGDLAAASALDGDDDAERGHRADRVGQQVEQRRGQAGARQREHADGRVAGVRDRRVGEDALDVVLDERGERAVEHGRGREHREDRHPPGAQPRERDEVEAQQQRERGGLGRGGHERGDVRRRALVDVGRPEVERDERDLERDTDGDEHEAGERDGRGTSTLVSAAPMPGIDSVPVATYRSARP
jgi:hypothetical protein